MNYFSHSNSNQCQRSYCGNLFGALNIFLLVVALVVFMAPALWNGFPLLFTDSLSYLTSGVDLVAPVDRPIFYGLYIRLSNLLADLWGALLFQAVLVIFLLLKLAKTTFPTLTRTSASLWIIAVGLFSSAPWFIGQMSPDIFTACLFLTMMIWAFSYEKSSILNTVMLGSLIVLECCMHSGNILIGCIFFAILLVVLILQKKSLFSLRKFVGLVFAAFTVSVILIVSSNIVFHQGNTFNRWGKVIFLARILEDGPGLQYLNTNCPHLALRVCDILPRFNEAARRERELKFTNNPELKNLVLNALLWDGGINEAGGLYVVNGEADSIIRGAVLAYPIQMSKALMGNTLDQFTTFTVGNHFGSTAKIEAINSFIRLHYPLRFESYLGSRQYLSEVMLLTNVVNPIYRMVIDLSVLLMVIALIAICIGLGKKDFGCIQFNLSNRADTVALLIFGLLGFLIAIAFITGGISAVFDRYQARVIWLVPSTALLIAMGLRENVCPNLMTKLFLKLKKQN